MLVTIVSISISGKEHRRYTNYCQVKHFYMKAEFHCLISVWKEYPMYNKSDSGIDSIILQHATIIEVRYDYMMGYVFCFILKLLALP